MCNGSQETLCGHRELVSSHMHLCIHAHTHAHIVVNWGARDAWSSAPPPHTHTLSHTHSHTPTTIHTPQTLNACRWGLSSLELCVISMLLSSLPPSSCRDIPIYLPKASNKVAHRLVVLTLLEGLYTGDVYLYFKVLPTLSGVVGRNHHSSYIFITIQRG